MTKKSNAQRSKDTPAVRCSATNDSAKQPAANGTSTRGKRTKAASKRNARKLTSAEQKRLAESRQEAEADAPYIREQAAQWKQAHDAGRTALTDAARLLKEERQRQQLSLADLEQRTGMSRPALSRLENDLESNPTVTTLSRYARALGKTLVVSLASED